MTASVLQETSDVSTTSESTVTKQFASACTNGSFIHAILIATGANITSGFGTPSDGTNTYTLQGTAQASNYAIGHWTCPNSSSSALTLSLAIGFTTTQHIWIIREIGGVYQVDASNANFNNAQATGSNAQSVAASAANQPNFASAVGWYYGTSEAVGTTLAWSQGQLNLQNAVQGGYATSEHLRTTGTGSIAATWTPGGGSGAAALACICIFDESLPPAAPSTPFYNRKNTLYFI